MLVMKVRHTKSQEWKEFGCREGTYFTKGAYLGKGGVRILT